MDMQADLILSLFICLTLPFHIMPVIFMFSAVFVYIFRVFGRPGRATGGNTTDGTSLYYSTSDSAVNLCNLNQWSSRRGRSLLYPCTLKVNSKVC